MGGGVGKKTSIVEVFSRRSGDDLRSSCLWQAGRGCHLYAVVTRQNGRLHSERGRTRKSKIVKKIKLRV